VWWLATLRSMPQLSLQAGLLCMQGEQAQLSGASAPAPTHVAVSTNSEHIRLFDCATLGCCATLAGHSDIVLCLDALRLPSGQTLLASGGKDNAVRAWVVPQGACIGAQARARHKGAGMVDSDWLVGQA
jgi:U3 small nucleolar RNA-associated protein 13